ncbi:hypothetical protein V5O48_010826 [Marasmius crinis-equi]|uniref:Integrase core domain-containing protein n=1 Tax=Marasmius crinis-equi TaxID=585013 RepID=A0ABR3F7F3_9AGAR
MVISDRSVHNIRFERLWRDLTRGFGSKWKVFFRSLETRDGLNPHANDHIWLLHYLFRGAIQDEATEWAEAWNHHQIRQEFPNRSRSPQDLFFFGELEHGRRDMGNMLEDGWTDPDPLGQDQIDGYGVDWPELENSEVLTHHNDHNEDHTIVETLRMNRGSRRPLELSSVEIPRFECPFTAEQVDELNDHLASLPYAFSENMLDRRSLWVEALRFCENCLSILTPAA